MPLPKLILDTPQEGYSFDDGDAVLRAKLSSGPSRLRLDMLDAPVEAGIQLVLDPAEYQYWRAFKRTTIANGTLPFLIDLVLDSADVGEYQVQIIPGSIKTNVQGTAHIVQLSVEVNVSVAPSDTDESIVALYELYGNNAPSILNKLAKLVNIDMGKFVP